MSVHLHCEISRKGEMALEPDDMRTPLRGREIISCMSSKGSRFDLWNFPSSRVLPFIKSAHTTARCSSPLNLCERRAHSSENSIRHRGP